MCRKKIQTGITVPLGEVHQVSHDRKKRPYSIENKTTRTQTLSLLRTEQERNRHISAKLHSSQ